MPDTPIPPVFGLILAGGASTRMRSDKAALVYDGRTQLERAYELVSTVCDATFVSVRADQREEPTRAAYPQIVDRADGAGPIAGIVAALTAHPKAAWLVLACDLPFVTEATLKALIAERDPTRLATAYRSSHDGLPEPLCAIWEPAARAALLAFIETGKHCPRKFLLQAEPKLLALDDARALDNINTPDELQAARAALSQDTLAPAAPKQRESITVRVQYFAVLREQAGRSDETLDTTATTPADLYAQLQSRYPFKLAQAQLKVAVNSEFSDWHVPLNRGDTIVFIPPVAGG